MSTSWIVLKYMADLRRREPRNVAIAVLQGGRVEIRAIGQRPDGSIDGHKTRGLVGSVDILRGWLSYWGYLAQRGASIEEWASQRGGDNYIAEIGGRILMGAQPDLMALADELFTDLVASPETDDLKSLPAPDFSSRVRSLLDHAGLLTHPAYLGEQPVQARSGEVYDFPHVWQNGHVTVATAMPKFSAARARDLLWQFEHLPPAASGRLVFTSRPLNESDNRTAGLLDQAAAVLPIDSPVEDVIAAFDRAG